MKINTSIINFLFQLLDKFFNIFAAPSAEVRCSDEKMLSMLQPFFFICGIHFLIFLQRLRLKVDVEMKKLQATVTFFPICGIKFSNIFAAPSAEGLYLNGKKYKYANIFSFVG